MNHTDTLQKITDALKNAKDVLILTHERPTADSIGSSLALSLALQTLGKKVTVAMPDQVTVEHSSFVGVNKMVTEVGKKNFVISLDYTEGSIEKVSYNIEGNTFNLVIEPRPGFEFSQDKVHYKTSGVAADCIIVVDTINLGGLKKLYETDKELFTSKPVINIDRHPNNSHFGTINYVDPQVSSIAELVYQIAKQFGVAINQDMASNLLNALYSATNNFTSGNVTANSFEIAAEATKLGARRFRRIATAPMPSPEEMPKEEQAVSTNPEMASTTTSPTQPKQKEETPSDWLKPKIFKSSHIE